MQNRVPIGSIDRVDGGNGDRFDRLERRLDERDKANDERFDRADERAHRIELKLEKIESDIQLILEVCRRVSNPVSRS